MNEQYEGRLELTWTNKQLTLLAHEDGSYEWIPPADYRVAEVRLLHDVDHVGEVGSERAEDNLLIQGDALYGLTALGKLPEFATTYVGQVKAAYIDPPFNTQQAFAQYDDALEHSVWLTMLRDRLMQIRSLLSPDGSVWVHLDDSEVHRARCVMDEVFGADNFVASVIWEKTDSPRMDAAYISGRHDTILVYRMSEATRFNPLLAVDEGHYKKVDDKGKKYYLNPLRARGGQGSTREARPSLWFPMIAPDGTEVWPCLPDGGEGAWRWSRDRVERDAHLIDWRRGKRGWVPYYRIYEPETRTRPPETIWPHGEVGSTRTSNREIKVLLGGKSFSTPKPERLLARILHIASNPGDLVLDCFVGSGTTAAVAHKMGRRWAAIEWSAHTIAEFARPRLELIMKGQDDGGISKEVGWSGGGGFRIVEVAPSLFSASDGMVFLADWATNTALGEATAAQLGYEYEPDAPFCGRKGRTRLAVIDGLVNVDVVRLLVDRLLEKERLLVCGTAVDDEAATSLRDAGKGSIRKIPAAILRYYERPSHLRSLLEVAPAGGSDRTIPQPEAVA